MFGLKEAVVVGVVLVSMVEAGKRNAQCDQVCQRKMTIECCECIGCHQGMRFGKRSQPFSTVELEEANLLRNAQLSGLEEALAEIELELANREPLRIKFNH